MSILSRKTISYISITVAFLVPTFVLAQEAAASLVQDIIDELVNPFILLMLAVAVAMFFWGVFMAIQGKTEDMKTKGKQMMTWGLLGLFIMFSVYSIINVIIGVVGSKNVKINPNDGTYTVNVPDITVNGNVN